MKWFQWLGIPITTERYYFIHFNEINPFLISLSLLSFLFVARGHQFLGDSSQNTSVMAALKSAFIWIDWPMFIKYRDKGPAVSVSLY